MDALLATTTGRLDRHVRRGVIRIGEGVSRHRVTCLVEESLRLAALPGEAEGRIYCFRRIALDEISSHAARSQWMERVQNALESAAAHAIHGGSELAAQADAVYFNNLEEALETLLRRAIAAASAGGGPSRAWYVASLLGQESANTPWLQIPTILERLRSSVTPSATAQILFDALADADPAAFLRAIPPQTFRAWLRELEGASPKLSNPPALRFPSRFASIVERAALATGVNEQSTLWLTAQAVLAVAPGSLPARTTVVLARATLREIDRVHQIIPDAPQAESAPGGIFKRVRIADTSSQPTEHESAVSFNDVLVRPIKTPHPSPIETPQAPLENRIAFDQPSAPVPTRSVKGEPTDWAGLYFLLNPLQRLGMAAACEACPALVESDLPVYLLRRLAAHAQVADDDPILACLQRPEPQWIPSAEVLAQVASTPAAWPNRFVTARTPLENAVHISRIWELAVRRWCWRVARISVRELVHRRGRVWLTRTDLDITMTYSAIDLRIRRAGLDIDPGWVPWFGQNGRVVRFHYRDCDPERL